MISFISSLLLEHVVICQISIITFISYIVNIDSRLVKFLRCFLLVFTFNNMFSMPSKGLTVFFCYLYLCNSSFTCSLRSFSGLYFFFTTTICLLSIVTIFFDTLLPLLMTCKCHFWLHKINKTVLIIINLELVSGVNIFNSSKL